MTISDTLDHLRKAALCDARLRSLLLSTRDAADPLAEFCRISSEYGFPLSPMDIIVYGEESYAAMRRSTNGGGENSPLLQWEDDYYELFLAEMEGK